VRICIVTHVVVNNDGQGRVNYEIVKKALAAGDQVTLLASNIAPDLQGHPNVTWVRIDYRHLPSNLLSHQCFAAASTLWLSRHRRKFDIVHVNGFITWARSDVNTAHFVHSGFMKCGYYPFKLFGGLRGFYQVVYTRLNMLCERRAFRRSRVVVPVSYKIAAEIEPLGVPRSRMKVIHNGVDTAEFAPGLPQRARFRLPEDRFVMLFAGDLRISRKNLDTVLAALPDTPPHVHLAVAGILKGSPYPAIVKSMGLEDRVHFLDMVRDMPNLMRSVDAFVFPSRYEAMSLVLLEALSAGLPVVTAKTSGGAEVITPECGVVLDDPDDAGGLAAAVHRIASDAGHAREMGAAARRLASSLSWDAMGERYMTLYRSLVPQTAPAAGMKHSTASAS
jgi:glycosyltransferase involved in cell wall biosynthesis